MRVLGRTPHGMFDGIHVFVCWAPGVVHLNTRIVVLGGRGCHSEYTYVCVGAEEVKISESQYVLL